MQTEIKTSNNSHIVGNKVFALRKKSKWTWEAVLGDELPVATAPSKPKLIDKLNEIFSEESKQEQTPLDLAKVAKAQIASTKPISNLVQANRIATKKAKELAKKKEKKVTKPKPKAKVSKDSSSQSMRSMTLQLMREGYDDDDVLKAVKAKHPDTQYNMTHVKWYRSNFAKSDLLEPKFAPKGSKIYKDWQKS